MLYPIILAGGSGTRLWPMSRDEFPKPFLRLTSEKSMIQETILRLRYTDHAEPIVVCNEDHRFLVLDHFEQISHKPAKIILEPEGKNTAPALTLAALECFARDPESILISLHADHNIEDITKFHDAIITGEELARSGGVVTFGVKPKGPNTGFGYIEADQTMNQKYWPIKNFIEKPNTSDAIEMVNSGNYLWNTGMFMMKASTWLNQIKLYAPEIFMSCEKAMGKGNPDNLFFRPDSKSFEKCPSEAIDYAVMEKMTSDNDNNIPGWVVHMDTNWSDVGTWASVRENKATDSFGNVTEGDVIVKSVKNSILIGESRTIVAAGMKDIVVIETQDAVLVTNLKNNDLMKEIVNEVAVNHSEILKSHQSVHRPWGYYQIIQTGQNFQVKRLYVKAGAALSLQKHKHRAEHWVVVHGQATVTRNNETFLLQENESTYIPIGATHRLENKSDEPLEIVEIQCGKYLGEDDIIRFSDNYNRII